MFCIYCKMITTTKLINMSIILHINFFFGVVRKLKEFTLGKFQVYNTLLPTIVTILCI
jgi:hypothetical protein